MVRASGQECFLDFPLGRCFGHAHPGGHPEADQGHAGEIISWQVQECLCVLTEELVDGSKERSVRISLLKPLPPGLGLAAENKTKLNKTITINSGFFMFHLLFFLFIFFNMRFKSNYEFKRILVLFVLPLSTLPRYFLCNFFSHIHYLHVLPHHIH